MDDSSFNQKVTLGRAFWAVYAVVCPVVLYVAAPWRWRLPLMSRAAGVLGLPFLFSVVVYVILLFLHGLLFGRRLGWGERIALVAVALYCYGGAEAITRVGALAPYRPVCVALLTASAIVLFAVLSSAGRKGD
jgi:hypothetical protein